MIDGELSESENLFARGFAQNETRGCSEEQVQQPAMDRDLDLVVSAWARLPAHLKAAILALVTSAAPTNSDELPTK